VILKITNSSIEVQRRFVSAVEELCVNQFQPLYLLLILKQLNDIDALEEEILLE
jgi:hypothetical protein